MRKLSEQEIERVVSLLKEGKPLPEDYKTVLFDTKKEYELIYADKEREEEIQVIADRLRLTAENVALLLREGRGKAAGARSRGMTKTAGAPRGGVPSEYVSRMTAPAHAVERRFLVGLVKFPDTAGDLFPGLTDEHFTGPIHRDVFRFLRAAWQGDEAVEQAVSRMATAGGETGRVSAGLLMEGEDEVYTRALLQHDYLRLQEQHVDRAVAGLRARLLEGDVDEETERKLYRLELLQHEVRQMLAGVEEG